MSLHPKVIIGSLSITLKIYLNLFEKNPKRVPKNNSKQSRSKHIKCVGLLINNPPAVQFPYKFEFILCKNWEASYKDIESLNC